MFPTILKLGSFRLATYGILVAAGYMAGIAWLNAHREEMRLSEKQFWGLVYALFFGAVFGGKLLYWAVEWRAIAAGTLNPISDFRYGFVFYGGVIGSVSAGRWYQRREGFPFFRTADFFGVALPIGHAIGRLGCFAAGCCAGFPTALPWGVRFTHPEALVAPGLQGVPLHPTQLYESAANAAIAAALARVLKAVRAGRLPEGAVALGYVASYALARLLLETFRGDDRGGFWLGLSLSQWIALIGLSLAALSFARLRRSKA